MPDAADQAAGDVLEEGEIFFLYRPTLDVEHPHDLSQVQHLYVALRPRGQKRVRLLVIGAKRLPTGEGNDRNWGFVDAVADDGAAIEAGLREDSHETKTRGTRVQGAARPAGEGVYALTRVGGDVHLRYALALPETPGSVQEALGIMHEGAVGVSVKNPNAGSGAGPGGAHPGGTGMLERHKPDYSEDEQALFGGNRWAPADPRLLDHRGAEFILIAVHEEGAALEASVPGELARAHSFTYLRMARTRHPVEPLFTGEWA